VKVPDYQTRMEIFESEKEDLKLEVAFLRKMISHKNIEHGKMKMLIERQKMKITELAKLVSDLKSEMRKNKASDLVDNLSENLDLNNNSTIQLDSTGDENVVMPGDEENDNFQINPMPSTSGNVDRETSPTSCHQLKSSAGSSDRKRHPSTNPETTSKSKRFRLNRNSSNSFTHLLQSTQAAQSKVHENDPRKSNVHAREVMNVSKIKEESDKVNFTIVTEEKDGTEEPIADLECSMRPQTTVRQVKKSYCKRMGLDRHKIIFRLAGFVNHDDTGMILREEKTVQGLEGRIVAAVRSVEQVITGGNEKSFQGNEISVGGGRKIPILML